MQPTQTSTPEPAVAAAPAPDALVRSSQVELIRLGYLHGAADGYMGPKTRGAISSFQESHGLSVTGTASSTLLARLQSTPSGAAASTAGTASAPSNWVAPTGSTTAAAASSNWVAPTGTANTPPAGAPAPAAASSGWVAPAK
jgi:peptidoglycan hydrolase-like protein with peptidoglycan-binding domain